MRSRLLAASAALFLAAAACQPAPQEAQPTFTAEDEAAIRGMLEQYPNSWLAGDWDTQLTYYTADAVRMPPDAPMIQGHDAIREALVAFPPITDFTLTTEVVAGNGDLAWARGAFTLDMAPPDADPVSMVGKWQAAYERQADGSWKCVSDIWNTDMPM
jgi:ketosteroid isomerase-like protein